MCGCSSVGPVALCLLGAGFDRYSVAFIGWFGTRRLASVIFALIALKDLQGAGADAVAVISVTILLSVLARGFGAVPAGEPVRRRLCDGPNAERGSYGHLTCRAAKGRVVQPR